MLTLKDLYDALVAFHKPLEAGRVDITKLRFVLHVRKSTTSDERQEHSISDQNTDCFDAADRLGIPRANITVIEEQENAKEPDMMTYATFLELFTNAVKTLREREEMDYRDQTIHLFFSNFVVDNEKVASFGLCQPFSDFFECGIS